MTHPDSETRTARVLEGLETDARKKMRLARIFMCAVLIAAVVAGWRTATAAPTEIDARIVWASTDHVYVVSRDSTALVRGLLLRFLNKRKTVATAEVSSVHDHELAIARLTSGSLVDLGKLDRLRVEAELPRVGVLPRLRIGFPAAGRANLLFDCARVASGRGLPPEIYVSVERTRHAERLLRATPASPEVPWPDTLLVRYFDDVADQEIAFERGELDVAVFWPGELSRRMRDDARWGLAHGELRDGLLVARWESRGARSDSAVTAGLRSFDFAPFNDELFRGDLVAWPPPIAIASAPAALPALRFDVDPACPGSSAIERFLNRGSDEAGATAVQLAYRDAGVLRLDPASTYPLFRLRSPVLWVPAVGAWVTRMGTTAIVDLLRCETSGTSRGRP